MENFNLFHLAVDFVLIVLLGADIYGMYKTGRLGRS